MGITGTEVAKESSDIIILDDDFTSVVKVNSSAVSLTRTLTFAGANHDCEPLSLYLVWFPKQASWLATHHSSFFQPKAGSGWGLVYPFWLGCWVC